MIPAFMNFYFLSPAEAAGSFFTSSPPMDAGCGDTLFGFIVVAAFMFTLINFDKRKQFFRPGDQFHQDEIFDKVEDERNIWTSYKKILYKSVGTTRMDRLRLFVAVLFLFMAVGFKKHALLTYTTSLFSWLVFPVLPRITPYFSLGKWVFSMQILVSALYGTALAVFVSIFYTLNQGEMTRFVGFSAISLLVLVFDADFDYTHIN